tara:strand:+ start:165 stop:1433 length:1269 start_codon:yes stop_codon:yes gene_type:complete
MSNYTAVNRVLIGDGTNAGAITHISGIQKGDLFLVNELNAIVPNVAAANALAKFEKVYIASGIGAGIAVLSSPIQGNTASKFEGKNFIAPSEQVTILGYNGVAATGISISADTEYRLRVLIKDAHRVNGMRSTLGDVNVPAGTNDTDATVAFKCACLFAQKDYGENFMSSLVKLERVSDGTFLALTNAASVIKGSKTVVSTAHALTGTGVIRIGGTGVQEAVYGYTVVDATTLTLDVDYVGETATVLAANVGGLTTVTEWGFKLTGVSQNSEISRGANEPLDQYEWINFDSVFSTADDLAANQEAAVFTEVAKVKPGQGFWKQVADREEAAKGNLGDTSKRRFYDRRINSVTDETASYGSIVITHAAVMGGEFQGTYTAPLLTEIYIPASSAQGTNTGTNFLAILNGYFATVLGFPVIPSLT